MKREPHAGNTFPSDRETLTGLRNIHLWVRKTEGQSLLQCCNSLLTSDYLPVGFLLLFLLVVEEL